MPQERHRPVLVDEVIDILRSPKGDVFIDATVGDGGHTLGIIKRCNAKKIIAIDRDPKAIERARKFLDDYIKMIIFYNTNFINIDKTAERQVDGILFDLGLSLYQLSDRERGFSFNSDSPLNMGMNGNARSVRDLINKMPADEIANIIFKYGDERFSRKIASLIVEERHLKPIETTGELVKIIKKVYPAGHHRIHPATRTFQALRIWANDELTNLEIALPKALELLKIGGVLIVISYHSLEDRIVKQIFKDKAMSGRYEIITKKPVRPSREEVLENRNSRSAKLRAMRRLL